MKLFKNSINIYLFAFLSLLFVSNSYGLMFPLPSQGNDIVGKVQVITAKEGDSFHSIGRRFDVGYYELVEANPRLNSKYLEKGVRVTIPTEYILPPGTRHGLVINLAELRAYYYPKGKKEVWTFPVGIGRLGWMTPEGDTRIVRKVKNPTWYVPASIREFVRQKGEILPDKIGPGPNNPLGKFAMRLGFSGYLIHGTNEPSGVGMRSSSGCIRLFPEDIKALFSMIPVGTKVRIINTAYKVGWKNHRLYLEAHKPLQEEVLKYHGQNSLTSMVKAVIRHERPNTYVNWNLAENIGEAHKGLPIQIGSNLKQKVKT